MEANRVSLNCIATIDGENIVSRELEGEAVMLNLESGAYFGLDEVGTRIWQLIQEHGSLRKVLEVMQSEFDAAPETLENDLLRLVEELRGKGLVSVSQRKKSKAPGN